MEGFKYGFPLGYGGPNMCYFAPNHLSVSRNPAAARLKLQAELSKERIAGPFTDPPFQYYRVSPLGVIPKKTPGVFRLIHDLSYPKFLSVNDCIPKNVTCVRYDKVSDVVKLLQAAGPGALMSKCDLADAFRLIPIHPADYPILGMYFEGRYYFDRCLPMGASSSCAIFESFSTALTFALKNLFGVPFVSHLIDDFVFVGPAQSNVCQTSLDSFRIMAKALGLPLKEEKTEGPKTCMTVYGVELDSVAQVARPPHEKVIKVDVALSELLSVRSCTVRKLQSVLGLLNFASYVIEPGRPFLRRLYDLLRGKTRHEHVFLSSEAKKDLRAWKVFIQAFNGSCFFRPVTHTFKVYTDASSSLACAAVFGHMWFILKWSQIPVWSESSITVKELIPVNYAIATWSQLLANRSVLVVCDNAAVVYIINSQTARNPVIMHWVRNLVVQCLRFNISLSAQHCPGRLNVVPDRLSRLDLLQARRLAPWLNTTPAVPRDPWLI